MTQPAKPSLNNTRWLFLRLLGVTYLIAFVSIGFQVLGLIGHDGISPASYFLEGIKYRSTAYGDQSQLWLAVPTLFWLNSSDAALQAACIIGSFAALFLTAGVMSVPALIVCYVTYLSLVAVGQEFLSFQWDYLLLETGFIAIFLAPWQLLEAPLGQGVPKTSLAVMWLLRFLLFKLMLLSGLCKLASHDPTWANLTALDYHYETQPLPTPIGYLAAQLPEWWHKLSVLTMFIIELVFPFAIFSGRKGRCLAAVAIVWLQVMIALTGNYTFFNFLTMALCITLIDDDFVARFLPTKLKNRLADTNFDFKHSLVAGQSTDENEASSATVAVPSMTEHTNHGVKIKAQWWAKVTFASQISVVVFLLALNLTEIIGPQLTPLAPLHYMLSSFGICNRYGLFAVMTTKRDEIVIEGSNDGKTWLAYEFRFKPGPVNRAPPIVAPYQPRLDWQMWFAALSTYEDNPWIARLALRLLQGDRTVIALLSTDPFREVPPRYLRASLYTYHFADIATLLKTGAWWRREYHGEYFPVATISHSDVTH